MKKAVILFTFFYVSWTACYDAHKDYTGKHEDRYGIKHSTVTFEEKHDDTQTGRTFSFGNDQICKERHATFENDNSAAEFLRNAPQGVRGVTWGSMEPK